MGKTGQSIGMVLCFVLAIISQMYSNEINDIFKFDVSGPVDTSAPLVGLQTNESWFVVLVDFQSNQLNNDDKEPIESEFQEYSREYFSQALGHEVNVNITIHDEIIRAPKPLSAYGDDGPYGRDYGDGTEFLPAILAQHVAESVDTTTLSDFDLNDDGVVDRFLILHSTLAQEQGSGSSNRIWSHFTSFSEPIKNGDVTFEHYTMSSMRHGINGFGTILHEMMHQFGAYDLYPVHDSGYSGSWKGIGVWDIMASGNWNGGGDTPSLPTGPTMAAIGHASTREVSLEWPANSPRPCIGPVIAL
ncbi:MAG: immune inhibitor A domain-containing protein, partial [Candidatus Thermoplasmatota archaeon]|nr:immune inhibitor A domain-containing protein [Candidatus Thermoplasmatota archaeon]